jgi:hypothetical protein
LNQTQLLQGVCQVCEPTLTPTERIFLLTLAAFQVRTFPSIENYPHPGNEKLMLACGVSSRQAVNKIADRLIARRLLEIVAHAQGGRGLAVVYRICVEDSRFPWPKEKEKPATLELPLSPSKPATVELPVSEEKPATEEAETRNSQTGNPQLDPAKPAILELHPDSNSECIPDTLSEGNTLPQETIELLTQLEQHISGQLSGWGWHKGQTKPDLDPIYKWFKRKSKVQGIDWRAAERYYNHTISRVRKHLEPTELTKQEPFTIADLQEIADEAKTDSACREIVWEDDGSLVLVFDSGSELFYVGQDEPTWHAFDDPIQNPENCPQNLETAEGSLPLPSC